MEASCPACIGVSLLADRVPALAGLTRRTRSARNQVTSRESW